MRFANNTAANDHVIITPVADTHSILQSRLIPLQLRRLAMNTLIVTILSLGLCGAVRVTVKLPHNVIVPNGFNATCNVAVEQDETLLSIKWYKNKHLFFVYDVEDDRIDFNESTTSGLYGWNPSKSTQDTLVADHSNLNTSGCLKCEAAVKRKDDVYHRSASAKVLAIEIDVTDEPEVTHIRNGEESDAIVYEVGEVFTARCRSQRSNPAAQLTLLVNDKNIERYVNEQDVVESVATIERMSDGPLFETTKDLAFVISSYHVIDQRYMYVSCSSKIKGLNGFESVQKSEAKRIRVIRKYQPIGEHRSWRFQKIIFYGFFIVLFSLLGLWYLFCRPNDKESEEQTDNVSNISAYDIHYRKASSAMLDQEITKKFAHNNNNNNDAGFSMERSSGEIKETVTSSAN